MHWIVRLVGDRGEYFVGILSMQSFVDFEIVFSRAHNIAAVKGTWETFAFGVGFFMFCEMTVCSVGITALLTDEWTLILAQILQDVYLSSMSENMRL